MTTDLEIVYTFPECDLLIQCIIAMMVVQKISFTLGLMVIIKALLQLHTLNLVHRSYTCTYPHMYETFYGSNCKHGDDVKLWAHI